MKHDKPTRADTLPHVEDVADTLDSFLDDWMPPREIQTSSVHRRVLLRRRSPQSQPIARPGEF